MSGCDAEHFGAEAHADNRRAFLQCESPISKAFFHTLAIKAHKTRTSARYTGAPPETQFLEVSMTRFRFALGLLLVLAALFAPALTLAASASSDKDAIAALVERERKAFDARDVDGVMACYAPGDQLFVFDAVPPREYPSWDAYKKDWEELFKMFPGPIHNTISELNITVEGPVAYSHSIEDSHFTTKEGADAEMVVRITDVYRKIGGKWLIVLEHVSFPVDPGTGKADMLSKP